MVAVAVRVLLQASDSLGTFSGKDIDIACRGAKVGIVGDPVQPEIAAGEQGEGQDEKGKGFHISKYNRRGEFNEHGFFVNRARAYGFSRRNGVG